MKRALGFMNKTPLVTYNTYVGGISASVGTAALLAVKLGISVGNITNFTIVGSDIKCTIIGSYAIPASAFTANANITYFNDADGLVSSTGFKSFYQATNLLYVFFKNATNIGTQSFDGDGLYMKIHTVYTPSATSYGTTNGNDVVFRGNYTGLRVYVNPALATNNAGSPDGDLSYLTGVSVGGIVKYVTNYTSPGVVSDLSVGNIYSEAIQLNFTPPSSANAIDFYEVFVDGIFKSRIKNNGDHINGLTISTSYTISIYAVDVFYNKSLSNSITVTTAYNSNKTEANTYVTATSNVDSAQITAIENLTLTLKNNGIFFKLKSLNIKVGGTAAKHKYNLVDARDLDAAYRYAYGGTWIHSATGAQANGTNAYANTYFNINTLGLSGNFSFGYYITVANTLYGDRHGFGAYSSGNNWAGFQHNTSTQLLGMGYGGSGLSLTITSPNNGFFAMSIIGGKKDIYHKALTSTGILNGTSLPTVNFYEGALNLSNSYYNGLNATYGTSFFGLGLTATEISNLQTAIITFETALGRNV